MGSPYRKEGMHPIRKVRYHIEWFLTTTFDDHDPLPTDVVRGILTLIVLTIIIGVLIHA